MSIKLSGVKKSYGTGVQREEVLKGVDLNLPGGHLTSLLGPSGSGKSTLLNILGGIETMDEGEAYVGEYALHLMKEKERENYRRKELGFVFQFYHLIPDLTVKENIEVGLYLAKDPMNIDELIEELDLTEHRNKYPNELSGGQQQRVSIGRALAKNPSLLLCDEPTGALDYKTAKSTLDLLQRLQKKHGMTVLIVTHNEALSRISHRVLRMHDGKIRLVEENASPVSALDLEW